MHKTKKELFTWIPDWIANRMRAREKKHGPLIFRAGQIHIMRAVSERWRDNVGREFKPAGPFGEPPTPHRFRYLFVRILLEKGVRVADVAELTGESRSETPCHRRTWRLHLLPVPFKRRTGSLRFATQALR
jgi:integrase